MIGLHPYAETSLVNYFKDYQKLFPSLGSRREFARSLLPVTTEEAGEFITRVPATTDIRVSGSKVRAVLAAQWGDGNGESFDTARWLYNVSNTTSLKGNQRFLRFSGLDPKMLFKEDLALPPSGFSITVGQLPVREQIEHYSAATNPKNKLKIGIPEEAAALTFQLQLVSRFVHEITVDPTGQTSLDTSIRPDVELYRGTVCLEDDLDLYAQSKSIVQTDDWVFGDSNAFTYARRAMDVIGGDALAQFKSWVENDVILLHDPDQR